MKTQLAAVLRAITLALFCDKSKNGSLTPHPSFAKFAFWLILVWFLPKPAAFTEYWFYTLACLLAYILFGTKFIPTFLAGRSADTTLSESTFKESDV